MSDYWLLEDITGVAEGAERARAENRKTGRPGKNEQRLISAAKRASVTLILMSEGSIPALLRCAHDCTVFTRIVQLPWATQLFQISAVHSHPEIVHPISIMMQACFDGSRIQVVL